MEEEMVELFGIDATPVGESRYPVGTEAKIFASDGNLVVKVNGEIVAKLPKTYEDQIRAETEKKIVLGARIGDIIHISVKVPYSRAYASEMATSRPLSDSDKRKLRTHGLDFEHMSDVDLTRSNVADIRNMDLSTLGSGLYSFGQLLSGDADTAFIIDLLKAQMRQQWVLVRQNEQIIRLLRDIAVDGAHSSISANKSKMVLAKFKSKVSEGAFVSVGDDLALEGVCLVKGSAVVSKLTPEHRDIVINAIEAGGSLISVLNVDGDTLTVGVSR